MLDREQPAARERVFALVRAAKRVADPADALGQEARQRLPETSGLSRAGVELALTRHLEHDPEPTAVEQLLASASRAPRCLVLLASNVCTAPLRALAWALATSPEVRLRPSRRDPVLAELLVRALDEAGELGAAGANVTLCAALAPEPGDELHLYGSDQTLAELGAGLPTAVRVQQHGTGLGVAAIGGELDLAAAAQALADDVVPFDQRGCLSPRFALVEGDGERARSFASELAAALATAARSIPRGPLDPADRAELARFVGAAEALGDCVVGSDHVVALDRAPRSLLLGPALRCVWVVAATAATARGLLGPWQRQLAALGGYCAGPSTGALACAIAELAPEARRSPLGLMQRPPLDGPVDQRPLARPHV